MDTESIKEEIKDIIQITSRGISEAENYKEEAANPNQMQYYRTDHWRIIKEYYLDRIKENLE